MPKNSLASSAETIKVLTAYGLSLEKQYGQNFLVDNNILKKIIGVSEVSEKEIILEIGGGIGTLSLPLCKRAKFVHIVELDKMFLDPLNKTLNNFENKAIYNIDALKLNCTSLSPRPNKMVSNLPYNIAAPLLIKLLTECPFIENYFFMVQREMAERFLAKINSPDYSALSVKIQLMGHVKKLFNISANCFLPKPNVGSVFVQIKRKKFILEEKSLLWGIIENSFHYRRKKMLNSLKLSSEYDENRLVRAFKLSGLSVEKRAQELSIDDFVRLADNY